MKKKSDTQRRSAVALLYEQGDEAPRVVSKADGRSVDQMLAIARGAGVPIVVNPDLAGQLAKEKVGVPLDSDLWQVLASLYTYVYKLRNKR